MIFIDPEQRGYPNVQVMTSPSPLHFSPASSPFPSPPSPSSSPLPSPLFSLVPSPLFIFHSHILSIVPSSPPLFQFSFSILSPSLLSPCTLRSPTSSFSLLPSHFPSLRSSTILRSPASSSSPPLSSPPTFPLCAPLPSPGHLHLPPLLSSPSLPHAAIFCITSRLPC